MTEQAAGGRPAYRVPAFAGEPEWSAVPPATIACFPWGGAYRPRAYARLCRVGTDWLRLRMWCGESLPRAVHTAPDSPVYQDSCLEFFVCPEGAAAYFNFEMNSRGTLLCEIGQSGRRRYFPQAGLARPACRPLTADELPEPGWGVEFSLPRSLFIAAFGPLSFAGGSLRGNFYKCGDRTAAPHYGCWAPVGAPKPDFHRPEWFGRLLLPD